MDANEVDAHCTELIGLIKLGPRINYYPSSSSRGRELIEMFRSTDEGPHIDQLLVALAYGFEKWFGDQLGNRQNDDARIVKEHLYEDIASVKVAMAILRDARGAGRS